MRLGQLARHLNTTTEKIVSHLASQGHEFSAHHNTKLPEDLEQQVILFFGKSMESEMPLQPPNEHALSVMQEAPIVSDPDSKEVANEEETGDQPEIPTANLEEEVPVIRAPKVALPGLKVVGKIELPAPKPKEKPAAVQPEEPRDEKPEPAVRYARHSPKNKRKQLTPEESEKQRIANKKQKEKREAERKRREKEKEEKRRLAKKKKHYEQKVVKAKKVKAPKKAKAPVKQKATGQSAAPRTWLGRFWRWLNT